MQILLLARIASTLSHEIFRCYLSAIYPLALSLNL